MSTSTHTIVGNAGSAAATAKLQYVPPDHEPLLEQWIPTVARQLGEKLEHGFPDLGHVCARGLRLQNRKPAPLGALVRERVVEVVVLHRGGLSSADSPQQPELLEMADVREVPDER